MQGQAQLRRWSMGGATSPKTMFSSTEQGEERKTTLKMKPHRVRKPFQVSCLAQVSKVARNILPNDDQLTIQHIASLNCQAQPKIYLTKFLIRTLYTCESFRAGKGIRDAESVATTELQ